MSGASGNHVTGSGGSITTPRRRRTGALTLALATFASTLVVVAITPEVSLAATMTVTTTADTIAADGGCSLREAITNANTNTDVSSGDCSAGAGSDVITFNIPGGGVQTITLGSALPAVTGPLAIDASTQPGYVAGTTLAVQIIQGDGHTIDLSASTGSSVRGLIVGGALGSPAIKAGNSSLIAGNWIGLNATGTGVGFTQTVAVEVDNVTNVTVGGTAVADRNVIGTSGAAVRVIGAGAAGTQILGNYIGTDKTGTVVTGNGEGILLTDGSGTIVGGTVAGAGNVISGSNGNGVLITGSSGTQILGNLIGTNATGTAAIPNGDGVKVEGVGPTVTGTVIGNGTAAGRNVISGNSVEAVALWGNTTGTSIRGNFIGIAADGFSPLGNNSGGGAPTYEGGYGGIVIRNWSANNLIGGTAPGDGNVIAYNTSGITIFSGSGNSIRGNSIHDNVELGLNIDPEVDLTLRPNDPGDVDGGFFNANYMQNSPVVGGSIDSAGDLLLEYSIDSFTGAATYPIRIEFFEADSAVSGEGGRFIGSTTAAAPGRGVVDVGPAAALSVALGDPIVGTATDANGNSSNFSAVAVASPRLTVTSTGDDGDAAVGNGVCATSGGQCTLRAAIEEANSQTYGGFIAFNITGSGVHSITPLTDYPDLVRPITIDGLTQPGASCASWPATLGIELNGTNVSFAVLLAQAGSLTVRGLVLNGYPVDGISFYGGTRHHVECTYVGTDTNGNPSVVGAQTGIDLNAVDGNVIGGALPTQRNLVAGEHLYAHVFLGGNDNVVVGNYLGTDVNGLAGDNGFNNRAMAVSGVGNSIGAIAEGAGNVIANSWQNGLELWAGGANKVTNNDIVDNGQNGIRITSDDNVLYGNSITGNAGAGVSVETGTGNEISMNRIVDNGSLGNVNVFGASGVELRGGTGTTLTANEMYGNAGLGIDIGPAPTTSVVGERVNLNHLGAAPGPNELQNYPVIDFVIPTASNTRLIGRLDGKPAVQYTIDVYVNDQCDATGFGEGQTHVGSFVVTPDASGLAAIDQTMVGVARDEGTLFTTTATNMTTGDTSEFGYCTASSTTNLTWVAAQAVSPGANTTQKITNVLQEKWFKFPVQPGDKVKVELTGMPGSAVSLHRDPNPIYNGLANPSSAAVLSAEAADTAFLPTGSLPSGFLPSGFLPSGFLPGESLPSGFLPSGFLPSGFLPSGFLPSGSLPGGSLPSGFLPSGFLPSGFLPSGFLPSGFLPSGSLPSGFLPSGFLPSGFLPAGPPDAYANASRRSLMGVAMDPYAGVQTIERSTFDLQEDLYVRVVGPVDLTTPFQLKVTIDPGVCGTVQTVPGGLPVIAGAALTDTNRATVILTDSSRLDGTAGQISTALTDLETLAQRADVQGVVLDLADTVRFPRVAFANQQADLQPGCPSAKNAVATEIKAVIDAYRAANVDGDATTLEYVVLAGGADVIPFHQVQDVAGLASEKEYVPPVSPNSPSEAGLRSGLVKGQDFYGSSVDLTIGSRTLAIPELAVGRLVDNAADVSAAVEAYIDTDGVVTPASSLVTGYDFVGDAAELVQDELELGTNAAADTLIQPPGEAPDGPNAWSADDLRAELLDPAGHDVVMLSGHFSAGNLLAADYDTTLTAAEVAASSGDFTNAIIMALGCHGGFSLPSSDLLAGASPDPDWAKAFLRKGVASYIAATGYAYGDTELTEYGERLFLEVAQQMRTGSGPISMGQALVAAKRDYMASTAQLAGIDEKTIVEMTLYGLPMMKVDMPGARLVAPDQAPVVTSTTPVPGATPGLRQTPVVLSTPSTPETKNLENVETQATVETTYYVGREGTVANPFEPILPKQIDNVTITDQVLRGVALRGATYTDTPGITPLTSAPTTESSRPHTAFNSEVFYPNQVWMPNFYDAVNGGATRLVTVPAQYRSSGPGSTSGTVRQFDSLDLALYYLPSDWTTSSDAVLRAAAISAAPSITGAGAKVDAGGVATFEVTAHLDGSAGVHSVWVLYTGEPGSPHHGTWTALDLTVSPTDPTKWIGTLDLQGADPSLMRFMVQAVNGAGLTALATNQGAFFPVAPFTSVPPAPARATSITLSSPASVPFGSAAPLSATLTDDEGIPLAGETVRFDIGGLQTTAVTNGAGVATASLTPLFPPGPATAQASSKGTAAFLTSTTSNAIAITKVGTTLATPPTATAPSGGTTGVVAHLEDERDFPLSGKSVVFVVDGNGVEVVKSSIADSNGDAALPPLDLPPGVYTVSAYFSGVVPIGGGQTLSLTDDTYLPTGPSTTTLTLTDSGAPTINAATTTTPGGLPYVVGTWTKENVFVDFTCDDGPLGSGIASCGPDTTVSVAGTTSVTGTAIDNSWSSTSLVVGPIQIDRTGPAIAVTTPASGASYTLGATVNAAYTCTDAGSGTATCAGPVASGAAIDTTTPGPKTFVVNATDALGNPSTTTVNYTVASANAAPVVRADMGVAGLQDVGFRSRLIVLTGSFTDADGPGPYTAAVRWTPTGAFSPFVLTLGGTFITSYLSPTNGTRTVTVRVCDARGTCGTDDVIVRTGVTQKITPVRQCVVDRGRTANPRYEARFGYNNPATFAIVEPTVNKTDNFFTSNPAYRGQPQIFLPGNRRNVFSATFNSGSISWKLDGTTVTANSSSPRC